MATLFLLFVTLLAADILTGFGFLLVKHAPTVRGMAIVLGAVFALIALFQGLRPPVIRQYEVPLSGLPAEMDSKVLIVISDLHLGSLLGKAWLESVVSQVEAQKPDMVALLGDIVEGHGNSSDEFLPVLRRLSAPLGVWAVLGNHEFHRNRGAGSLLMQDAGFKMLRNSWAEIRPGLILAGVDSLSSHHGETPAAKDPIAQSLSGRPAGATIFLSHTPEKTDKVAQAGVGLMLCGHTHGGQVWPFGYLVRQRYPMLGGLYRVGRMSVIVCRGTGTWGPRMRLWYPNEILRITLRKEN
jgi:predicted MPP superfamily phosphohydrolase